jgi:hypothetical protein
VQTVTRCCYVEILQREESRQIKDMDTGPYTRRNGSSSKGARVAQQVPYPNPIFVKPFKLFGREHVLPKVTKSQQLISTDAGNRNGDAVQVD